MNTMPGAMSAMDEPAAVDEALLTVLGRDLRRYREFHQRAGVESRPWRVAFESFVFKAGFQAVVLYRISQRLQAAGLTWLAWCVARANLTLTGADIEFSAHIGPGLLIAHPVGVVIGRGTVIGADATVFQGVTCGVRSWEGAGHAYPCLGDRVVLFARCSVLGGIRIGHRAVIGAHALVVRDVPDDGRAQGAAATIRDAAVGEPCQETW